MKSANTEKSSKSTAKSKKSKSKNSNLSLVNFFRFLVNKKMIGFYGIILGLFSICVLISMFSFYLHAQNNISFVESAGTSVDEVENVLKQFGAYLSYFFMKPFGFFSIGIPVLMIMYSVAITIYGFSDKNKSESENGKFSLLKTTIRIILLMFFFSFTIGIFTFDSQYPFVSGYFGNFADSYLYEKIGYLGLSIVAFTFLLILLFIFNDRNGDSYLYRLAIAIRNLLNRIFENIKLKREERKAAKLQNNPPDLIKIVDNHKDNKTERSDDDLYISEHNVFTKEIHSQQDRVEKGSPETEDEEIPFDFVDSREDVENNDDAEIFDESESDIDLNEDSETDNFKPEIKIANENTDELTPDEVRDLEPYDPRKELSHFEFPPVELLEEHPYNPATKENMRKELLENKQNIEKTLLSFGIAIKSISAVVGPTVTLYEIVPKEGVRISKIKSLEDDIALSLAALGIRIIAPIPGRGTIGIEVPNKKPEIVSMRDIITSEKFKNNNFALPVGLGKTISNEPFVVDLAKMPHLLVAGATGQGKSVGLNAIISSLLYTKHPAEMKFVLVDPKKVEFTLYSTIENYYLATIPEVTDGEDEETIITDTKKVVRTLNSLCLEMDNRYDLLKKAKMRNIREYNAKFCSRQLSPADGHRFMPYIVVVIDEFGDLIMTAGREVEQPLARLAQLARAIGIHLVIATQRPSVNIITGSIKANFPARIAFRVQSGVDSKTILDATGANQLIGKGDMLISTGSDVVRLQCAFVDTPEVEKIAEFIGNQSIERPLLQPYELPYVPDSSEKGESRSEEYSNPEEFDSLIVEAASLIVQTQQGSTSSIQRKMSIGYNRAGRIMDQLEDLKIVGPGSGSKPRQVLVKSDMELRQLLADKGLL